MYTDMTTEQIRALTTLHPDEARVFSVGTVKYLLAEIEKRDSIIEGKIIEVENRHIAFTENAIYELTNDPNT